MPDIENPEIVPLEGTEGEGGEGGEGEGKKPELTPDQLQGIKKRQFTRLAKELGIELPKPESDKKVEKFEKKSEGFDLITKTFLKANGVVNEDYEFVQQAMEETGKSVDALLESKYFQAELKERGEARATANAIPSSTKRAGSPASDQVEYWINKGELPPASQVELRRKVVNAKIDRETKQNVFSQNPVV